MNSPKQSRVWRSTTKINRFTNFINTVVNGFYPLRDDRLRLTQPDSLQQISKLLLICRYEQMQALGSSSQNAACADSIASETWSWEAKYAWPTSIRRSYGRCDHYGFSTPSLIMLSIFELPLMIGAAFPLMTSKWLNLFSNGLLRFRYQCSHHKNYGAQQDRFGGNGIWSVVEGSNQEQHIDRMLNQRWNRTACIN